MTTEDFEKIIKEAEKDIKQGNYREAQALLEKIFRENSLANKNLRAKAFLLLGTTVFRQGDYQAALMHLKTAQRLKTTPSWVLVESIRMEGTIQLEKGKYDDALERYNTALDISKQLGNKKTIAACLNNIAIIHMYRGEFEPALEIFDEGLAIAVEAEDKEESGKILNNMAEIFTQRGQYDLAYEHYRRSLALDQERGDKAGMAIVLGNISEIYKARGDYKKSLEFLQEAYNLSQEIGFKRNVGGVLSNLGELHWLEKDLRKAAEVLEQGINVCKEIGTEDEVYWRMLILLAGVQTDRGLFEEAEQLLQKCEILNERMQSNSLAAALYCAQGYLESPETGKGNLGNAKLAYKRALELAEHEKLRLAEIWINASLGLAHTLLGEYATSLDEEFLLKAEKRLGLIFNRAKQESQVPILCKVMELQGLLALAQMEHEEALAKFDETRKLAKSRGLTYLADKATEQYEKVVQMRAESQKMLAKDTDTV
ncbi:MAG: tetratricopeptide repeat protein, partial [Candidatus Hodarchaeota archaeon]